MITCKYLPSFRDFHNCFYKLEANQMLVTDIFKIYTIYDSYNPLHYEISIITSTF